MIKLSSIQKLMAAFIFFIAGMLVMRIAYADNLHYVFLLWNLFLAWIPFQPALLLTVTRQQHRWHCWVLLPVWLLFFPNSLYIVTDLMHLENINDRVPVWYDAVLLFTAAIAGLIMAYASLLQVERFFKKNISAKHTEKLVVAVLFTGSFGVYIGRFLRWNSWDIITNPFSLLQEVAANLLMPFHHYRTWMVTLLLTCLFSLLYYAIKKLPALLYEPGNYKR